MSYCYLKKYITATVLIFCLLLQKTYAAHLFNGSFKVTPTAATDTIKGVVFDSYMHTVPGVKVAVLEIPGSATVSNSSGEFKIAAATGNTLNFTAPGFYVNTHKIKNKVDLKIRLTDSYLKNADTLDVLYGKVTVDNNLGSIASIYTNQVTTTPATIYPYALTGRLPGLYTAQFAGYRSVNTAPAIIAQFLYNGAAAFGNNAASDNTEIVLSLRGQNPVTIIDGVQREFSSIDFENIESISILKDALSTILLGQRSSNGILLVTTKKPLAGTPRISFMAQTGFQQPLGLPTPLPAYKYAYIYNEALQNNGSLPAYSLEDFNAYRNGTDPTGHPDVNWYNTLINKSSPIRRYNLSLNGGTATARYVVSLGYLNQQGMFKDYNLEKYSTNAELNRYTVSSNVDVNLSKNFNVALQLFGRIQNGTQPGATTAGILQGLYTTPNNAYPIYNPDGSFGGSNDFKNNLFSQLTRSGYILDYARDVMVNLDMTYKFDNVVKGLWAKVKGNLTTGTTNIINRSKSSAVYNRNITGTDTVYNRYGTQSDQINLYSLTSSSQFWYAQLSTGIDRQFGNNNISAMIFADQRQATINFDLPGTYTNLAAKGSYNYKNKYFSEIALTYSGYDRYEPGKRFGWFYAGGLGWKISEETFIKDNAPWIDLLKLRATYGKTGNANIGYYTYRSSFQDGSSYNFGATSIASLPGLQSKTILTTVGATWEKANKFDVGLDFNVLNNAIRFTADYYHDRYYDLMQPRGTSTAIIGSIYPNENIGINLFTGTEFSFTYQNHIRGFNYFITANTSIEQTKILFQDEIQRKYAINKRTGQPINTVFGFVATGIIQTPEEAAASPTFDGYVLKPGDLKYVDQNGDGKITPDYDLVPISSGKPRIYYGTTLGFSYKGIDFSILLQGVQNRDLFSAYYGIDNLKQTFEPVINRWTPANTSGTLPRVTVGGNVNNIPVYFAVSYYKRSGNYFRIKNVDIGYNLPAKWVNHLGISGLRIFANGLNLFTASGYDVGDPEVGGSAYPIQRVFNTGVSIKL